ncbi:MAG TPA: hypothetical protein PLX69_23340 [Leptospiraceae bacterium]|nr:hypothetical protein [Leptospiraceae bacterium]HRG77514.1 hypothetical protein [Leptospiraceae bacterium]
MKFSSPILKRAIKADKTKLPELLKMIKKTENPFLIVSESEMNYIQVFWTSKGYIVEYQEGSIKKHFESVEKVTMTEARKSIELYMDGDKSWKERIEYVKMKVQ